MAKTEHQRRWRANATDRKRIEVYLPVDTAAKLDGLAAGASRAKVLSGLIEAAAPASSESAAAGIQSAATSPETPALSRASTKGYRFRRPSAPDEQRYQWIAEADEGQRIGLGPDPVRYYRWRGIVLDGSIYLKETKGDSRDAVVRHLWMLS